MKRTPTAGGSKRTRFNTAVEEWFRESFAAPTPAQERGWTEIAAGRSTLVCAPTGSGKTLAAFLAAIDRLMFSPAPAASERCRVLYVSPLKALAVDVERNLRAPLAGIARVAARNGSPFHEPQIGIRTGDTPAAERARMARKPPDILITTPESLFLVLTSNARETLRALEVVIVDEIHALAGNKRGSHLAMSLERCEELVAERRGGVPLQRIGLSATQRPLEEVARFLGGGEPDAQPGKSAKARVARSARNSGAAVQTRRGGWTARPVAIVDASAPKTLEITVEVPLEDMAKLGEPVEASGEMAEGAASAIARRSIWPAIHPRLLALVRAHRSTIIFVNSRRLAERLSAAMNELAGTELVRAHHGSVAREERREIEEALKAGRLPAIVATSSLELGIDMGAVDLVVQIESPPSVASGMQRIGRAGHQVGAPSRGVVFPKFRGDLLTTAAVVGAMQRGEIEPTAVPANPLDVLAQQLVAACAMETRTADDLFTMARRAAPFATLPHVHFEAVLDMLSGRYPSDEFAELKPRLTWDRTRGTVRAREGARRMSVANAGTIPDRGLFGVFLADGTGGGRRVGELDEEMVFESRVGEVFMLGASSWRIAEITHERVLVLPAPGEPGKMPFWHGDSTSRPVSLGLAIGALARTLAAQPKREAMQRLTREHGLDRRAATNLLAYLDEQRQATGAIPDDRTIVVERGLDEMGSWRVCIHSPFGGRVHAPWAMAIEAKLAAAGETEAQTMWSDDGIVVHFPERERPPESDSFFPAPEEIEDLVVGALGGTALFAARFRECAGRALLLPRRRPGQRSPLWVQRRRAADLLAVAARYGSFPIILETYRECLRDVFDMAAFVEAARRVQSRELRVVTVDTRTPSPFAASLVFGYVATYLYEGDAPLAERRAQALSIDMAQLRELLGEPELRELLDAQALAELESRLQWLDESRHARSADRVHDMLLALGDLSPAEIAARCSPPRSTAATSDASIDSGTHEGQPGHGPGRRRGVRPDSLRSRGEGSGPPLSDAWLALLKRERRIIALRIAGENRFAAAEDAGRYRDALGVPPPAGLPGAFLEPVPRALEQLAGRWARTHGPFAAQELAARWGLGIAVVEQALARLAEAGRLVEGEMRPGGRGREWCDNGVLRDLKQRSLARLRKQVEPVEPAALARLALDWQRVIADAPDVAAAAPQLVVLVRGRGASDLDALLDVVEQLQGAAFPASALEQDILPARLPRYRPEHLDAVCAAGEVVWAGIEPLGERDGRLALFLADQLPALVAPRGDPPGGEIHERLRAHLAQQGASFFAPLLEAAGGGLARPVVDALWDLVWSGEISNDGTAALRAFLALAPGTRHGRPRSSGFRSRRLVPPAAEGRWTLLPRREVVVRTTAAAAATAIARRAATERLTVLARQLLARHGVLTREAVAAEIVPASFSALYPVLRQMEEAGRIRRGWFVAGLAASQFALPGALERLRALRETAAGESDELPAVVLAATDPANPYGATLRWPERAAPPRPMRAAGAHVVLADGRLAAFLGKGEKHLLTFLPEEEPERTRVARAAARALAAWARSRGGTGFGVALADGAAAADGPLAPHLLDAGFVRSGPGLLLRRLPGISGVRSGAAPAELSAGTRTVSAELSTDGEAAQE